MHSIKLYNTLTRSLTTLSPLEAGKVSLYCCGPTVYNYQHIGNFRTFLFEDILVRTLRWFGYTVDHVMNITDVGHLVGDGDEGEDKMLVAARKEKKKSLEIAEFYTDYFFMDWDRLGLARPNTVCKATDHIKEMIELAKRIEDAGFAYLAGGNLYFDVEKFSRYGDLAKLDLSQLKAGSATDIDNQKKSPFDFVLWFTKSKFENQELQWDSPWGRGYPGWHIECSAMSIKYLGEKFDIHCGGIDHIPVHHTNEIAQSEAATGKTPWVSIWMHSEFLLVDGEKMSKSKENFYLIQNIVDKGFDPLVFRWLILSAHYKTHLNFTWDAIQNASNTLKKLKRAVSTLPSSKDKISEDNLYKKQFAEALSEDLNTPRALAVLFRVLDDSSLKPEEKRGILEDFDNVLALDIKNWRESEEDVPQDVQELVEARAKARKEKNWKESDRIRDELKSKGFEIEDKGNITSVRRV